MAIVQFADKGLVLTKCIKVLIDLFQKVAGSWDRVPSRASQGAKFPYSSEKRSAERASPFALNLIFV